MIRFVPRSYRQAHGQAIRVELASDRPIRHRNKSHYRIAHWPVWVFAFFLAPGPITFSLFARGAGAETAAWLTVVTIGTAIAGLRGWLPGTEPRPYVLLYGEDTPNPLHRRISYTVAWGAIVSYALLNLATLLHVAVTGVWRAQQIFEWGYYPVAGAVWAAGVAGRLPRAKPSTQGEGVERRYFYGAIWTVAVSQVVLLAMWKTLPVEPMTDRLKLAVFVAVLAGVSHLARRGLLPRTRPILPGTIGVAD